MIPLYMSLIASVIFGLTGFVMGYGWGKRAV